MKRYMKNRNQFFADLKANNLPFKNIIIFSGDESDLIFL